MRVVEVKGWTIDEHPNKDKVYEWVRENWHDLNDHSKDDLLKSLWALQKEIGGDLDYAICTVPARGEYISIKNYDREALSRLSADDCPLTGSTWDYLVISYLRDRTIWKLLDVLHEGTEYQYKDEQIYELCDANGYEFAEDGSLFPY